MPALMQVVTECVMSTGLQVMTECMMSIGLQVVTECDVDWLAGYD